MPTNAAVLIDVKLAKDRLDTLLGIIVAFAILLARQIVDGLDQLVHFFLIDRAVGVRIVEFEAHLQFFANVTAARGRDGDQVLEKVDFAALVRVEHVEDLAGEFLRFALRVEFFEHVRELFSVEFAFWTVFLEKYEIKQTKLLINKSYFSTLIN